MKLFQNPIWLLALCALIGCKEEYYPKVKPGEQAVLVVEGVLNSNGPTTIKLSRTVKLNDSANVQAETGAQLTVEGKNGTLYQLTETGNGTYSAGQLFLEPTTEYRLHFYTADGSEYASDYVAVRKNPPIDSINWKRDTAGVTIFVNSHNPENDTRYYRWEYEETWEIHSAYFASVSVDDGIAEPIFPAENLYTCWRYGHSSAILLGNTTQLAADVIFEKPLLAIYDGDDKLSVRYTMLVRQYALDKKGYDFYQLMKRNTESLGSLFDAQPTEAAGNVHSLTNAAMPVIGYISASAVDTSRIWITKAQVFPWKPEIFCSDNKVLNSQTDNIKDYVGGDWVAYYADRDGTVYIARIECVSCRVRGGSTHKPSFW